MMTRAWAIGAIMLLGASASAAPDAAADKKALRFTLDSSKRIYKVGVSFAYQTTIWTPVACADPAVGDPEYFIVKVPDATKRRFIVTPANELAQLTNVTFDCDDGVRFSIEVSVVPPSEAALVVEFELDPNESSRVRAVVEAERKRCADDSEAHMIEMREQMQREEQELLMKQMLRRLAGNDDVEAARQNFVIVKVAQELLVGERGYIVFSVQNRTSKEVVIKDAEVLSEDGNSTMSNAVLVMPEKRVGPDSVKLGVIVFDAPEDISTVTLAVHEDGPRVIRVTDIDF